MATNHSITKGSIRIDKVDGFWGIHTGPVAVTATGRYRLYGIVNGDIEVEAGGAALIFGIVNGRITNAGVVQIHGIVNGLVDELPGSQTEIASGAFINGEKQAARPAEAGG